MSFIFSKVHKDDKQTLLWIAGNMANTLDEVLGAERTKNQYTSDWLFDRALSHIDGRLKGAILLVSQKRVPLGYTILRQEGETIGLFSTIYIDPSNRELGLANQLVNRGEKWFKEKGISDLRTVTDQDNFALIGLFEKNGYKVLKEHSDEKMVELQKN